MNSTAATATREDTRAATCQATNALQRFAPLGRLVIGAAFAVWAQASFGQGQSHMRDIWEPRSSGGITAFAAGGGPNRVKFCPTDCQIDVQVVSIDPPNKSCAGSVLDASGAPAEVWLIIPFRRNPVVTWNLTTPTVGGAAVIFTPAAGVSIHQSSAMDFDPGTTTGLTFSRRAANGRLGAFAYDILLEVTPNGSTTYTCTLLDPIVINRGN